jgi:L-lactate dehydrogenase complex protein LldG
VAECVLALLHEDSIDQILAWDENHLPGDLLDYLSRAGVQITQPTAETIRQVSHVKAGITAAMAGVADTGSLLLLGGSGQPLSASLVPEIHIALLHEKDIYPDLSQVIHACRDASAAVLVTGPSRTADIEMTLTIGVHGPGELHVICIKN